MQLISDAEYQILKDAGKILETWRKKSAAAADSAPTDRIKQDAIKLNTVIQTAEFSLDDAIGYLIDPEEEIVMSEDGKTGRVYHSGILHPDWVATLVASVILSSTDEPEQSEDDIAF